GAVRRAVRIRGRDAIRARRRLPVLARGRNALLRSRRAASRTGEGAAPEEGPRDPAKDQQGLPNCPGREDARRPRRRSVRRDLVASGRALDGTGAGDRRQGLRQPRNGAARRDGEGRDRAGGRLRPRRRNRRIGQATGARVLPVRGRADAPPSALSHPLALTYNPAPAWSTSGSFSLASASFPPPKVSLASIRIRRIRWRTRSGSRLRACPTMTRFGRAMWEPALPSSWWRQASESRAASWCTARICWRSGSRACASA